MEIPRFSKDSDDTCLGIQQVLQDSIFFRGIADPPGAAEGGDLGVPKLVVFYFLKKINIFRVRARPTTFDIVNSQGIKFFSDPKLIFRGEKNPFSLRSVAKRGIIKNNGGHCRRLLFGVLVIFNQKSTLVSRDYDILCSFFHFSHWAPKSLFFHKILYKIYDGE